MKSTPVVLGGARDDHLEGEALNVALLMSEGEHANREGLSQALSNYYNSPGRWALFRRKFESVTRRAGADPATELEILFIAAGCWRVTWSRRGGGGESSPGTDMYRGHTVVGSDSRESTLFMEDSLRTVGCPEVEPRIPVSVASVVESDLMGAQEMGSVRNRYAYPGKLPSHIARLIRAAQEDNPAEVKVRRPPVAPSGTSAQSQVSEAEPVMVCFSCGRMLALFVDCSCIQLSRCGMV